MSKKNNAFAFEFADKAKRFLQGESGNLMAKPFMNSFLALLPILFVLGLALFVVDLKIRLFLIGESMTETFAPRDSLVWLHFLLLHWASDYHERYSQPILDRTGYYQLCSTGI